MAVAFYSLLFALSWADVSLVAPASASLTFVSNAVAANFFLHEKVDHFRWVAAILVAGGRNLTGRLDFFFKWRRVLKLILPALPLALNFR